MIREGKSATLATSPKPESSRNYVGLVKAHASPPAPPMPPPPPSMHCTFATWQLNHSLEKRCGGASEKFHLLALQSSTEKSIWHRLEGWQHCYIHCHDQIQSISDYVLPNVIRP